MKIKVTLIDNPKEGWGFPLLSKYLLVVLSHITENWAAIILLSLKTTKIRKYPSLGAGCKWVAWKKYHGHRKFSTGETENGEVWKQSPWV